MDSERGNTERDLKLGREEGERKQTEDWEDINKEMNYQGQKMRTVSLLKPPPMQAKREER